jgi:hypothetical protein
MRQATTVTMSADSTIDASATDNGDGGKVVLWSAIDNASSVTTAYGTIRAKAGVNGGDGGRIETSGHSLLMSGARINAYASIGKSGLWLIDPTDVTIDANAATTIVSGLATGDVQVSADRDIVISANIATNTNYKLLFSAGGSINMTGGFNIWLNTSNTSTYSASTGTGSLYMGGVDVTTINSSNWNSSCVTTCYAQASSTSPYAAVRLGVSSPIDIRVGGDVVVAGRNTQSTGGYAGNVLYSGSVVWGSNVSFYGISTAGVGQQLSWGTTAQIDLKATNTLFIAGESSFYTADSPYGYGSFLNGSKLTGSTVELWGLNTNASCTAASWCAGVSLGWVSQAAQLTDISADVLKLKSNTVVLGASPVNVTKLNSTFGIDFSSYDSSSVFGFKNNQEAAISSALPVAGSNYSGSLVLPSGVGTSTDPWSTYRYSGNSSVSLSTAIYSTGSIGITARDIALNYNLYTTNTSTGDISLTGNISGSGNIALASGRGLTVNHEAAWFYGGVISGTNATLSKYGNGRLSLTNVNTYSGGTTLNVGALGYYVDGALGTGTLTGAGGTLMLGRGITTFANNINLTGNMTATFDTDVEYLIVAGGGGGAGGIGGGGGAGEFITGRTLVTGNSYTVKVGAGGVGGYWDNASQSGSSSSVFGISAAGGGGGGTWAVSGQSGGSGGGAGGGGVSSKSTSTASTGKFESGTHEDRRWRS